MAEVPDRVDLVRTGGFANIAVRASVAAPDLTADEKAGLDALLALPPAAEAVAGAPDRQQYDVSVVVGGKTHHVRLGEHEVDERVRPLIKRLEREAAP
jgi:emfourin